MNAIVPHDHDFRQSTDAAGLCGEIVKQTAKNIQGRQYVAVEGWQAIAIAHGCAASARGVERVEGGVRAIGEVRRMSDGQLIAAAEGFVGEDEPVWFGGTMRKWKWGQKRGEKVWFDEEMPKRPDYAIRAMAQTRAISRACRSAFAHVVVMIDSGLSTTPAEEVPDGGFVDAHYEDVTPKKADGMPDAEWSKLVQLIEATGSDTRKLCGNYGVSSLKELTFDQYSDAIGRLNKKLAKAAQEAKAAKAPQQQSAGEFDDLDADSIPY